MRFGKRRIPFIHYMEQTARIPHSLLPFRSAVLAWADGTDKPVYVGFRKGLEKEFDAFCERRRHAAQTADESPERGMSK